MTKTKAQRRMEEEDESSDPAASSNQEEEQDVNDHQLLAQGAEDTRASRSTKTTKTSSTTSTNPNETPCSFDLRNLLGLSDHPVDVRQLYNATDCSLSNNVNAQSCCIPSNLNVSDDYLLKLSEANTQQLITELWKLPMQRHSDVGPMAQLPSYEQIKLPRSLPVPPPKIETKWEQFAKLKGIGNNKDKRTRKVWDEDTQSWKHRFGYDSVSKTKELAPILEADPNDVYADPWQAHRDQKRQQTTKSTQQQLKNQERAGLLKKGTTNRLLKGMAANRDSGRHDASVSQVAIPTGVPVDLYNGKQQTLQRGKVSTTRALQATQKSTASLGTFDPQRPDEPARKRQKQKAKHQPLVTEAQQSQKILQSLQHAAKSKAAANSQPHKGETAYDYEFQDVSASSFRKKKGRAGAGKPKKLTKKRIH